MKITVKIEGIELIVERPQFTESSDRVLMKSRMEDTIKPTIEFLTEKAKELYLLKK